MEILEQKCRTCDITKPISEYHKNKTYSSGFSSECKECRNLAHREWYNSNKSTVLEKQKVYEATNKEIIAKRKKLYIENNQERIYSNNKIWKRNNLSKNASYTAKRRASLKFCTPKWLTEEQKSEILKFYNLSYLLTESTGVKHHVDHIEPINGENFTGLHVPWNLQVIPHYENESKGNKLVTT